MTNDIMSASLRAPVAAQEPIRNVGISTTDKVDATKPPLPGSGNSLPQQAGQMELNRAELDNAVKQLNDYVQNLQRDLQFSIDKGSGRTIIKVIDSETKEIIRQFPSEEILKAAQQIHAGNGLIIHAKA